MRNLQTAGAASAGLLTLLSWSWGGEPSLASAGPRTPQEEKATFRIAPGFRIELVAHEPTVIDPVSMCFDEAGALFVAEMHGYPNAGAGTGPITSGVIKVLEDKDDDGFYETSRVYADGLRFPMGLMPYRGGLIVTQAPDILFFEDTRGQGKADRRRVLYTGFALGNIQQMINTPQWGLDNWVYGNAATVGGDIRSVEKPDAPVVSLRGRGVRFHPDVPGSLEPTSGGGQYGLTPDEYQRWFVNTNSQHLRHIVLPDQYLRRNPLLPVGAVSLDIPEHGAACKVFRLSPFEAWRVERTTRRRADSDMVRRLSSTELVAGGYVTSGCSPCYYAADAFPPSHRGSIFVCDPANNLVLRDALAPRGATFTARRVDADFDFLASTDNWFRPVHLSIGPDGALYVLDFYREVIETPLSLPDDIKKRLNLETRQRGRIWRVTAEGAPRGKKPALRKAPTSKLVDHLADANIWWRLNAQRLLIERQDRSALPNLEHLAKEGKTGPARAHALWALHGLHALPDALVVAALKDGEPGVREQGLRLADERIAQSPEIRSAVVALADDANPRVRFQLAFTLGEADVPEAVAALAKVARQDANDPWTAMAVLSSASRSAPVLLRTLVTDGDFIRNAAGPRLGLLTRLAALVGARADDTSLAQVLVLLRSQANQPAAWQLALLDGLSQGLRTSSRSLAKLWDAPPPALKDAVGHARSLFEQAAAHTRDNNRSPAERTAALNLLAGGPFGLLEQAAPELLTPQAPAEVQLAAARALNAHDHPRVAELLLAGWPGYSPAVRREVLEGLFARAERLPALLAALEDKRVLANQIEPPRLEQLRLHPDAGLRRRAVKLLAGQVAPERKKVVDAYRAALDLPSDKARGKTVFKRVCASCHRLENEGHQVGADLLAALRNKTREQLLQDIMDPSREVDPRYFNYVVTTKRGQSLTGLIAAETATSLTLRRGEGQEDTLLRSQIEDIQATAKSVMPEGLETQVTKQDLADVIAYLQVVAVPK